jgi:hypothetical protein
MTAARLSIVVAFAFVLNACASLSGPPKMNEPPKGYAALFNGKDLTGWKGLVASPAKRAQMSAEQLAAAQAQADENMRAHWRVADGVLVFDGKGSHLCTVQDYGDFEMLVDWKIEEGGDSGIYLRGSPQVQIWDPKHANGVYSGALYNNQAGPSKPLVNADAPVGEWNSFYIKMVKDRVTVRLNGQIVVDDAVMENYWERDKPIYPIGQIELQSHGSNLYFRNVFIREIPRDAAAKASAENYLKEWPVLKAAGNTGRAAAAAPRGPQWINLFNGRDLTGWSVPGTGENHWIAEGRRLICDSERGGSWLATDREYGNFDLELEFKVPPGGNSGVFLRAPLEGKALEIQILDDYAGKHAGLKPSQYTGSLYNLAGAKPGASKKAGEWQTMSIQCQGKKVRVVLNGVEVVLADLEDYRKEIENEPGMSRMRGRIGLQDYGQRVEFRNIRIKTLN